MHIINSFDRLPVGKYVQILGIDRSDREPIDKEVAIISVLTGMTETEVLNLPLPEFKALSAVSHFLRRTYDGDTTLRKSYQLGGLELIPTRDVSKMTAAQYIDFQTTGEDDVNLVATLSAMLVPKGCTYGEGYDFADVQRAIAEEMTVADALTVYAFFLVSSGKLIPDSLRYSRRFLRRRGWRIPKAKRMEILKEIRAVEDSLTSGDGLQPLTAPARPSGSPGTMSSESRSSNF